MKIRPDMEFGNKLRDLRKLHGFSQESISAKLQTANVNISRSLYSKFETAERNIPISIIRALKQIYNCEYNDFFE